MEAGGRPEFGVCAAVDVHYLRTGGAQAAAVLAADAVFAHVLAERTTVVPRVPPYRPGEFYLRELPLHAVLHGLSGLGLLMVDGYADQDPGGRPGCACVRRVRHPGDRSS
jgi:deoxyribonuclease V